MYTRVTTRPWWNPILNILMIWRDIYSEQSLRNLNNEVQVFLEATRTPICIPKAAGSNFASLEMQMFASLGMQIWGWLPIIFRDKYQPQNLILSPFSLLSLFHFFHFSICHFTHFGFFSQAIRDSREKWYFHFQSICPNMTCEHSFLMGGDFRHY